jgi:hypothetical protein
MVQFKEIIERIRAFAPRISNGTLSGAVSAPEASASPTECFANVERKVQQASGSALYGWMFHYREVAATPGPGYLIAVNHAVWCAPDKKLVDVTPFHSDPKHHPIVVHEKAVLFLIDSNAAPLTDGQVGLPLPSWFFPLTDNEAMVAYVAGLQSRELEDWEKRVADADALKVSERAADLLRSRRR